MADRLHTARDVIESLDGLKTTVESAAEIDRAALAATLTEALAWLKWCERVAGPIYRASQ